jgi:Lrp/AsnC family transcriptional regulator, leucine-responsive regulatory protein
MSVGSQENTGKTSGSSTPALDEVDRRLLAALVADPRASRSELARRTGVSTPTASARLARLERLEVIRGYRVDVDPAALGLPVAAWVRVRPGPGQLPKLVDLARRTPEVAECQRVTGEDCLLVRLHAPSLADLEVLLDRFLLHGQTTTSVVVSTPVSARCASGAREQKDEL